MENERQRKPKGQARMDGQSTDTDNTGHIRHLTMTNKSQKQHNTENKKDEQHELHQKPHELHQKPHKLHQKPHKLHQKQHEPHHKPGMNPEAHIVKCISYHL